MGRRGRRGRYRLLSPSERELVVARLREGVSVGDVAVAFGSSRQTVERLRDQAGSRRRGGGCGLRLSFAERERISRGIAAGESARVIARELGRAPSTVSREIARCGGRRRYRAVRAQRAAKRRSRRPKASKLSRSWRLVAVVERGLERRFSPRQISARLKVEYPHDREMRISPETIYQSLYVQSRGEFRRQLAANLRTGRTKRRAQGRAERRGQIAAMIPISARPAEVEDRAVPGHWEGDLLVGAYNRSFIATLVERHTRYVMLAHLGRDRSTTHVIEALKERIRHLPQHLTLSLTWDQGNELTAHQQFTVDTGVQVYFCDPHSPWQRGSNENTNGLLRQYLPKGTDLAAHTQADLDHIAAELNDRPRETLGWMTPTEKLQELLR